MKIPESHKKKLTVLISGGLLVSLFFFIPHTAQAIGFDMTDVAKLVGSLFAVVIWLLGKLLVLLIYLVVWVAQYNGFISSDAVRIGWEIVRDVCNMFFIVILLVIAFATVLNIEKYSWKKQLPRLLLMAVLINFSKLICGVVIDFAQVIMLTFVNGFRDIAGGNFGEMLGIMNMLNIGPDSPEVSVLSLAGTYILAVVYVLISLVVITVILFILIMRIIMLWILVVLSPLYFLLKSTPDTESYAGQWQKQFVDNVVSGPLLAFFIWLSFASLGQSTAEGIIGKQRQDNGSDQQYYDELSTKSSQASAGLATAGTPDGALKFVISIGMLVGGLMITKQLSGAAGAIAGKGLGKIEGGVKKLRDFGTNTAKSAGKSAAHMGLRSAGTLTSLTGQGLSKVSGGYLGEATKKRGEFISGWGKDIKKTKDEASTSRKLKTLNKFGIKKEGLKGLDAYQKASFGGQFIAAGLSGSPGEMMKAFIPSNLTNLMGGKIKQFSTNHQTKVEEKRAKENVHQTATVIKDLETNRTKQKADSYEEHNKIRDNKVSELETERTKKIQSLDTNEAAELAEEKARYLDERAAMQAKGATPGEINQHDHEYKTKLDTISGRYSSLREKTNTDHDLKVADVHVKYEVDTKDIEAEINSKYQKNIDLARQYHRQAKQTPSKQAEINTAKEAKTKDLDDNEADRQTKLKDIRTVFASSPAMVKSETAKANDLHDKKVKDINQNYETKEKEIDEKYKDALPVDRAPAIVTKLTDKAGNAMEQFDPLELTNAAIKKGLEAMRHAAEIFSNVGFKKLGDLGKVFSYGARGSSATTTELWTMMSKGNAEANDKLTHLIKELEEISSRSEDPSKDEKDVIKSMKEGLGSFLRDKPEKKSAFTVYIEKLNKVDDTGKKVEDYIQGKGTHK
jgi:hypothetical protein